MQIVFEFCLFLSDFPTRQIDFKSIVMVTNLVGKSDKKKRIFKTISIVIQNVALATPGGGSGSQRLQDEFPLQPTGGGGRLGSCKESCNFLFKISH